MRNTKKAFTLVELIVVITILAILGTIAFISLQGYSADARNSKRTSDIGNIQSAISLKSVEGVPLMSFVTSITESEIATLPLAGVADASLTAGVYAAGNPSYTVLNVAAKDFKDPSADKDYKVGVTTLKAGVFQIAATMEVDGTPTAQVNGTYVARTAAAGMTGAIDSIDTVSKTITLADSAANMFKAGDTVNGTIGGLTGAEILKVSRDGVTITLDTTPTGTGNLVLAVAESAGLIGSTQGTDADLTPVVNLSTTALAY